jgi:hypothetical protein
MSKLPPMPSRDAGGMFSLSNPDDDTPIKEMFSLDSGLLFITEKCTYQVKLADQIDPKRTNPALPHNVQSKLFDHGTNSELLCNTLILAKVMFRKECQPQLNIERAMQLAFAALSEAVSMNDEALVFKAAEQRAMEKAQLASNEGRSVAIPTVGNVRAQCKTFLQKADHFAVALSDQDAGRDRRELDWLEQERRAAACASGCRLLWGALRRCFPEIRIMSVYGMEKRRCFTSTKSNRMPAEDVRYRRRRLCNFGRAIDFPQARPPHFRRSFAKRLSTG